MHRVARGIDDVEARVRGGSRAETLPENINPERLEIHASGRSRRRIRVDLESGGRAGDR